MAVALAAVTVVARDPAAELQLTVPAPYRATLLRRIGVLIGLSMVLCSTYCAVLALSGWWAAPAAPPAASAALVWAGPLFALTGLAVLVATATGSVSIGTAVVSGVWLLELLTPEVFLGWARPLYLFTTVRAGVGAHWTTDRVGLLAVAAIPVAVATVLLGRPERLLTEEER